ncbi:hypothetical protein, partial [Enterococcus faecium]
VADSSPAGCCRAAAVLVAVDADVDDAEVDLAAVPPDEDVSTRPCACSVFSAAALCKLETTVDPGSPYCVASWVQRRLAERRN